MAVDPPRSWRDFDAVVIDVDGVVSATAELHAAAWHDVFDDFLTRWSAHHSQPPAGFDVRSDYARHVQGRPPADAVATFLRSRFIELPPGRPADPPGAATCWGLGNRKNAAVAAQLARSPTEPFADAVELVDVLTAEGKTVALTSCEGMDGAVATGGLDQRPGVRLAGERRARGSRRPADMLLRAALALGVRPADVLVLTAAPAGVAAAHASGFGLVVGVQRAGAPVDLAAAGADVVVPSPTDLLLAPTTPEAARELLAERTFVGLVVHQPERAGTALPDLLSALGELAEAGVAVVVVSDGAVPDGVPNGVEVCSEDVAADVLAACYSTLAEHGTGPGLVLVAGWLAGLALPDQAARSTQVAIGPAERPATLAADGIWVQPGSLSLIAVAQDQLARRRVGRVPSVDLDPAWTLVLHGDEPEQRRVHQTLLTLADSRFGTRGVREEEGAGALPRVLAAGIFDEAVAPPILLEGPIWTGLHFLLPVDAGRDRRILDLRTGVLLREQPAQPHPVRTMRLQSLARPGAFLLRAEGGVDQVEPGPPLLGPGGDGTFLRHRQGQRATAATTNERAGRISAAARQGTQTGSGYRTIERLAAFVADPDGADRSAEAEVLLGELEQAGFDRLLAEQRTTWAQRWCDADIEIVGDPELQVAVRHTLFHLIGCAPTSGEAAIGARGVAGPGYGGHVFWDADVFVLPFLAATCPSAARAMLEYRIRRLPAARQHALDSGRDGVRFPWESAREGTEVTPSVMPNPTGVGVLEIRTGELEEHIQADVAWAALQYVAWTGDVPFLAGTGRPLLLDTARYWASRIRVDDAGRGHIDAVIGPDEYHEDVDDNAFTNVMTRWHLRRASEVAERHGGADADEVARWRALADALVDGYDPATGRYEQFAGYDQLEPLVVSELAATPVAADLLFGQERISASQVIKQPDVLMFQHLVPEEAAPGSLGPNLDFYEPRCAHGSSLSPAIHAAVFARAGRPDEGLRLFRMAALLDLHNLTGTTTGGLHTATAGGVWQALVHGFGGIRPTPEGLVVDPQLPASWQELRIRLRFRGHHVQVHAGHDEVAVTADGPTPVQLPEAPVQVVAAGATRRWTRGTAGWEVLA